MRDGDDSSLLMRMEKGNNAKVHETNRSIALLSQHCYIQIYCKFMFSRNCCMKRNPFHTAFRFIPFLESKIYCRTPIACRSVASKVFFLKNLYVIALMTKPIDSPPFPVHDEPVQNNDALVISDAWFRRFG